MALIATWVHHYMKYRLHFDTLQVTFPNLGLSQLPVATVLSVAGIIGQHSRRFDIIGFESGRPHLRDQTLPELSLVPVSCKVFSELGIFTL